MQSRTKTRTGRISVREDLTSSLVVLGSVRRASKPCSPGRFTPTRPSERERQLRRRRKARALRNDGRSETAARYGRRGGQRRETGPVRRVAPRPIYSLRDTARNRNPRPERACQRVATSRSSPKSG